MSRVRDLELPASGTSRGGKADADRSLRVINITPEKQLLRASVLDTLHAHFWQLPSQSAASLDGCTVLAPGAPAPLPACAPSGLSRTQFLVAAQAATLPAFPSVCQAEGGVVADRVLLQTGGQRWWAALTGRAKVQRILTQRRATGSWTRALGDLDSYALGATGRVKLRPSSTTLKLAGELQPSSGSGVWGWVPGERGGGGASLRASSQLQHRLRHAELRATLACNQRQLGGRTSSSGGSSSSGGRAAYETVPLTSSLDLSTPHHQASPLQFRAGVYHVGVTHCACGRVGGLECALA